MSSDLAGVNQVVESLNLPSIYDKDLFEDRLNEYLKKNAAIINTKIGGTFSIAEIITFKKFFITNDPFSSINVYRKCFNLVNLNLGNIASGATVNFVHGINNLKDAINIYVSCVSTSGQYFTCVYPDIYLTATNIFFTNPNANAVSSAIAICEYTKE